MISKNQKLIFLCSRCQGKVETFHFFMLIYMHVTLYLSFIRFSLKLKFSIKTRCEKGQTSGHDRTHPKLKIHSEYHSKY